MAKTKEGEWIPFIFCSPWPSSWLFSGTAKQRRIAAIRHVLNRKRNSGKDKVMEELARQFIGKECIIYTVTSTDSSIQGTVKDVTDGGIVLEKDGNVEAVNLEYVTRIREYPRNAKGKRKTIVF